MPKFKKPLSQHLYHQWGMNLYGAGNIDPNTLAQILSDDVKSLMEDSYGIKVSSVKTDVTVGGFFNSKTFPGVVFSFDSHADWARYLVGIDKTASIIAVDVVQQGSPSSAMQRVNVAETKSVLSVSRAIQMGITNQNAVEEERLHYGTLIQAIQQVVGSWTE